MWVVEFLAGKAHVEKCLVDSHHCHPGCQNPVGVGLFPLNQQQGEEEGGDGDADEEKHGGKDTIARGRGQGARRHIKRSGDSAMIRSHNAGGHRAALKTALYVAVDYRNARAFPILL